MHFFEQILFLVVFVDQHCVVEHILQPVFQILQLPEIHHKVVIIEFITGEVESDVPVIAVDVPAVTIVVCLSVRTWQIVKGLGG